MAGAVAALLLMGSTVQAGPLPFLTDPTGDTFGVGPVQPDITTYNAVVGAVGPGNTIVQFNVNFAGPIAPPSAFAPNSVVGFIDLDIDRNPATGGTAPWGGPLVGGNSWLNFFISPNPGGPLVPGPLIGLGDEFFVDIGSELFNPGFVDVINTSTLASFNVPITFMAQGFSFNVPLAALGSDGKFNFGLLFGTFQEPTDRAPNGALAASSTFIPEPGSLLLLGTGVVGLLGWHWRRRQAGIRRCG